MKPVALKVKDTAPSILTYRVFGEPIDITGYSFTIKIAFTPEPLVKVAEILNQTTDDKGRFKFSWGADDLTVGQFPFEIMTTFPDSTEKTSPTMQMNVEARIG